MARVSQADLANVGQSFDQLPVWGQVFSESWTSIRSVLHQLETGAFTLPARLLDYMLRDDRVYGVLNQRVNGLLGAPRTLLPADDRPLAKQVAEEIEELYDKIFPHAQLKEVVATGIMLGWSFGSLEYKREADRWLPQLRAWHAQNSRYQWSDRTYHTITRSDGDQIVEPNGRWFVWAPHGKEFGYLRGAMRAIARPWLIRTLTSQYWARYSEVHGLPVRAVEVPASANEAAQRQVLKEISRMNSEATIRLPKLEDGTAYGLKLVEATGTSYEGFSKQIEECNREIAIALLGQAMSTEGSKGLGSHDKAGEEVRQDIKEADALIVGDLRSQVLEYYCEYNYGDRTLAPIIQYEVQPPEDGNSRAQEILQLSQALATFRSSGVEIDVEQLLQTHSVPVLSVADMPDPAAAQEQNGQPPTEKKDGSEKA